MPATSSDRGQDRMRAFKNKGKDSEELRRRRNEVSVELRKNKREDVITKRRNVRELDTDEESLGTDTEEVKTLPTLEEIKNKISDQCPDTQFKFTQAARKILSRERNPPIDDMIKSGIVPKLVQFLERSEQPLLQFEASWALTNIASGSSDQTRAVVDAGAVPRFVALLSSPDSNVCEQAVWALGNIAGDGSELRDLTISCGIVEPLLAVARASFDMNNSFVRNIAWTISNLCRNKNPSPAIEVVRHLLPMLLALTQHCDSEVLADTCWAMSYLTDGSDDRIQEVVNAGVAARLVHLLSTGPLQVMTPALRALGNIVTGTDEQTDVVIGVGAVPVFISLLTNAKSNIVKEATWTLSNITAGNSTQIQSVIDAGGLVPLINVMVEGDFRSKKEAAWALTNLTSGGTVEQIVCLCASGALKPMCDLLNSSDDKLDSVILDGLHNILSAAAKQGETDKVCIAIEECGGLDAIEKCQEHGNDLIYRKALAIVEEFFAEEDEEGEVTGNVVKDEFQFGNAATGNGSGGGEIHF